MREQNEDLQEIIKLTDSRKEMRNIDTGTTLKVLSAEAYTKHGINPTVVIFDEIDAQRSRALWAVMTFGSGSARREPLWWVITTAGDDPDRNSIGWEIHELATRLQDGEAVDPNWYVKIFNAPEDADIFAEETWYQANPSLGQTIDIEAVRQEALYAKNSEAGERLFRWLRLNQWVSLKTIGWLPLTLWDSTVGRWEPAELVGRSCFIGLDLASTTDLTAAALLFPPDETHSEWRTVFEAWIPEDKMRERAKLDKVPYEKWVKERYLHATPGNAVDYDFVEARLKALARQYDVQFICADPWNSRMLTQRLDKEGIKTVEVSQTIAGLSPGMKEMERLFRIGMLTHESNPVARWCFGNIAVAMDGNENLKPMKNKSRDRIDVIVALINAMNIAMLYQKQVSPYETQELVWL